MKVEFNVNISTNCKKKQERKNPATKTAQFKYGKGGPPNKSISIVKEEDESKEISKIEEEVLLNREESKHECYSPNSASSFSSSSDSESEDDEERYLREMKIFQTKDLNNLSVIKQSNFKLEDHYDFLEVIGEGGYGKVIKVLHKGTGQIRACKIQDKSKFKKNTLTMVRNEIEILKITDHPNIVKVYEFTEDENNFNIVMEYCQGGELFDYIGKKGTFTEGMACKIIKQILSALAYLHANNIMHSDLKAENIMFVDTDNEDLHVKIIDFGMATKFDPDEKLSSIHGSPYYIAPEVLMGSYDSKADVWS